jgi:hypothetical protein
MIALSNNNFIVEFPSLSLSNEVYRGSLDIYGVSEWICTSYNKKVPILCENYRDSDNPFLIKTPNKEENHIIWLIVLILILIIFGFAYLKYSKD